MELIYKEDQLIENVKTLHNCRKSKHRKFYEDTIGNGATFIVIQVNDEFLFGPSRFVGYSRNTPELHERNVQNDLVDGRITNKKISKLVGKDREDALLEMEYLRYCEINEIKTSNRKRKYFPLLIDHSSNTTDLPNSSDLNPVEDLAGIITNIMIFNNGLDSKLTDYYRSMIYGEENVIALKIEGSYYFAPALYAAYTDFEGMNLAMGELLEGEYEDIISDILNQEFSANRYLDEQIITYIRDKEKKFNRRLQKKYCYIDLDESDYELTVESGIETKVTEKESNVNTRIGQVKFRSKLILKWGECSVTGCKTVDLLRASHIKPWADSSDFERLDVFNGLLLIPNLDLLFDQGYISFDLQGKILISEQLDRKTMEIMGVHINMFASLSNEHQKYMAYHRNEKFKN